MSKEENNDPVYLVEEEDEEEILTIDFKNQQIFSKEEHLYVKNNEPKVIKGSSLEGLNAQEVPTCTPEKSRSYNSTADFKEKEMPTMKDELQDLLLNTITSKAISSLLKQHKDLDTDIVEIISKKRMGKLNDMLENEIDKVMETRRRELKNCFSGSNVKYENIPEWSKNYIKDYYQKFVNTIAILAEDE